MTQRPLPISGLPLAPTVPGLTVMEDVRHATSSHPRRPIAPIPLSQPASVGVAAAAPAVAPRTSKRPRWHGHGNYLPPQHRPRPRAAAAATEDIDQLDRSLFPARRTRKEIPDFIPIRPESFDAHRHPLAIRTPLDIVRFFPLTVGTSAVLAALSGLLAGGIANRVLGGEIPPVWFTAGYLALFLLNLLTHYFAARGQLFFANRRRFLRLLVANTVVILPHFIVYSVLLGMGAK